MAHFAKIGVGSKVEAVVVVDNGIATTEQAGEDFLQQLYNSKDTWKQTSYNTNKGVHSLGGTPLRKNYAGIGNSYDSVRDAFIAPKPYPSWTLNESTCGWDAPVTHPEDEKYYEWDESITNWKEIT
jgi:hypothetical protein